MTDHQLPLTAEKRMPLLSAYISHLKVVRQRAMLRHLEERVKEATFSYLGCVLSEATLVTVQETVDDIIDNWWSEYLSGYGPVVSRTEFQMQVVYAETHVPGYTLKYSPALLLLAEGCLNIPVNPYRYPSDRLLLTWEKFKERMYD